MENKKQFIVTERPPWYFNSNHTDVFGCERSQGLFDEVVNLMTLCQEKVSERENGYKPKTIYKTIRSMVIGEAGSIQQKPTRSLLLALMDLVDIEGGNDLEPMPSLDKAGLKHILLAHSNHTCFYVPKQELTSTDGKKVIPVITQYSGKHNFMYYDSNRSMIGTYMVFFSATQKNASDSYFVQEVLFVPGFQSLELLKKVTGNKFDFWDMALEVPTHLTALTPSFQQIQLFQLLRTEAQAPAQGQNDALLCARTEDIDPMCCVLGADSADFLKKRRETSVDCFTESQVVCNLKHFEYPNGGTRTVYCRRKANLQSGKRVFLAPVVNLRKDQVPVPKLYVSTTLRFCRAIKHYWLKGNGESVKCWNETLQELQRDTFLTGTDMHEEIYQTALAAFIKRVNPNSWCNYIPKHVENMMDPIMVEVVELAIKFMDSGIPNAFAVAELLYCPIDKVQKCLKFWTMYVSDKAIQETVTRKRISIVEEQMRMYWTELSHITLGYVQQRYKKESKVVSACVKLFKHQTLESVVKAQKNWQALFEHSSKEDKALTQLFTKAKILFLKMRVCGNKLKKRVRVGKGEQGKRDRRSLKAQDADASALVKVQALSEDKDVVTANTLSVIVPKVVPISSWIKNMAALLLSEPWLNDNNLRREAVCTLLGLDGTLLNKKYHHILSDWVIDNRSVVRILENYGLQDKLSKALVTCLRSTSTDNWRRKILLSFGGTKAQPRSPQCASSMSRKAGTSRKRKPQHNSIWLSMAEEINSEEESYGEEEDKVHSLQYTVDDDNAECSDHYANDSFIDDTPIGNRYSPSENEESEEDRSTKQCGGKDNVQGYKRTLQTSSEEEESMKPDVKRVKRTKRNCRRTEERHSVSASRAADEIQTARKKKNKRHKNAKTADKRQTFPESKRMDGEEKRRGGTKRTPFKSIHTLASETDSEQEEKSRTCRVKAVVNKQMTNLNSEKLTDSEPEREENQRGAIQRAPYKLCYSPVSDVDFDVSNFNFGKLSNLETEVEEKQRREIRRTTFSNRSNISETNSEPDFELRRQDRFDVCETPAKEQQDTEKQEFGVYCEAPKSHEQRLSQEAEKVSKTNKRDLYQEEGERLGNHLYYSADPPSVESYTKDDSDQESYGQPTLDKIPKGTEPRMRGMDYMITM